MIISNLIFAQEKKKGFSISFKGGITFANMYGDDVSGQTGFLGKGDPKDFYTNNPMSDQFKTGINIGSLLNYRFGKYFSIGLGTKYIEKGCRVNKIMRWNEELEVGYQLNGYTNYRQNFLSFEFPISFYLPINSDEIYFSIGYSYSFYLNSKEVGEFEYEGVTYDYYNDRGSNKRENGIFIGCGYSYAPNNKGDIIIELEWNKSLDNLGKYSIGGPRQYYYNQAISLSLGYKFKI